MSKLYAKTRDGVYHDLITTDKVPVNRSMTGYGGKIPTQYKVRDSNRFLSCVC